MVLEPSRLGQKQRKGNNIVEKNTQDEKDGGRSGASEVCLEKDEVALPGGLWLAGIREQTHGALHAAGPLTITRCVKHKWNCYNRGSVWDKMSTDWSSGGGKQRILG